MRCQWFANRGQILQTLLAAIAILVAIVLNVGLPNVPAWLLTGLVGAGLGFAIGAALQYFSRARRPTSGDLVLVNTEFIADDREQIVYKRKLSISLRNNSDTAVIVGPQTKWIEKDLHVNTVAEHLWQVEGPRGWRNNDWTKEAVAVRVDPGKRLRTWVGLPNDAKKPDVDHCTAEHRAGVVVTSVTAVNDVRIDI